MIIIAFEGVDGAGKGTQSKLFYEDLVVRLKDATVKYTSFPSYTETYFGSQIGKFLDESPEYKGSSEYPKLISLMYSLDRFEKIKQLKEQTKGRPTVVVSDRYTYSNVAYQTSMVTSQDAKFDVKNHILKTEFDVLGLPKPKFTIFLDIDPEQSKKMVSQKQKREYTDLVHDVYEKDPEIIKRSREAYISMMDDSWIHINCMGDDGTLRTIEDIQNEIVERVVPKIQKIIDFKVFCIRQSINGVVNG